MEISPQLHDSLGPVCSPSVSPVSLTSKIKSSCAYNCFSQGGRGHWEVYYTSPQSFIITFLTRLFNNFWDFYRIMICWFIKLSVQRFQPLILTYNFVHHCIGHCFIPLDPWFFWLDLTYGLKEVHIMFKMFLKNQNFSLTDPYNKFENYKISKQMSLTSNILSLKIVQISWDINPMKKINVV